MSTRIKTLLFSSLWSLCALAAGGAYADDLPDIGSPADAILTQSQEAQIGRMIMHQLRESGQILTDPELTNYIQEVGHRLAVHAHQGGHQFTFFIVDDPRINAFALPGGYIGINTGLLMATETESELAGVLAHEISHVTQRHIARRIEEGQRVNLVSTAAVLAAIILGATTGVGADAVVAAMSAAQGAAAQKMLNYTRSNEYEADRIGIRVLADAGFDPYAMSDFFETLGRQAGGAPGRIPEYLQTHPLSSSRIAESRSRASQYPRVPVSDSMSYRLARERSRVLAAESDEKILDYYRGREELQRGDMPFEEQYGLGLALLRNARPAEAEAIFSKLLLERADVIAYHTALGQAQLDSGDVTEALDTLSLAAQLFPRNVPVTIDYSKGLVQAGQAKEAHRVLLDLLNNIPPTPEQARLIARIASEAGDTADAHYYMSEYHILNGELPLAMNQLQLALAVPDLDSVQRARFEARLREIRQYLPENQDRRSRNRQESSEGS